LKQYFAVLQPHTCSIEATDEAGESSLYKKKKTVQTFGANQSVVCNYEVGQSLIHNNKIVYLQSAEISVYIEKLLL